jgi:hypothetical protein
MQWPLSSQSHGSFLRENKCFFLLLIKLHAFSAFFPLLVILHFVQLFFYNILISREWFVATLFGNSLWLVAIAYYVYITFLGYS